MSNLLIFTGRVARSPVLTRPGSTSVVKFTLIRNEYAGKDESGATREERVTALPFTFFGSRAEAIAENVMEGDQLIVQAHIQNNNHGTEGDMKYDYNFVGNDFEFGAPGKQKRAQLERARVGG